MGRQLQLSGLCLTGMAVGAYACLVASWMSYEMGAFQRLVNFVVPLWVHTSGCFEPKNAWRITTGQVFQQMSDMLDNLVDVRFKSDPIPLCSEARQASTTSARSLVGHCSDPMPNRVQPGIAGPLEPIAPEDVVLCTHTSSQLFTSLEPVLSSWQGPVSLSVFAPYHPTIEILPRIRSWLHHLAELGLRQVMVSIVGPHGTAQTEHDKFYPANLLRQVAIDAAVNELILLVDPGFAPSAGLFSMLRASSPLGAAVRSVLLGGPAAFLVASFMVFEDVSPQLTLSELYDLVEAGNAVSYDAHVCPLCSPYAWQWLLLMQPGSLQFPRLEHGDLYNPAWLVPRSVMPRLPPYLHGIVSWDSGDQKIGWMGVPCGLRISAQQLRANNVPMLLLPGAFVHRHYHYKLPNEDDREKERFNGPYYYTMLCRRAWMKLPPVKPAPQLPRVILSRGHFIEVGHSWQSPLFTLQQGSDPSMQVVVRASSVVGSEGLQRLVSSLPWTVHAVAVGAADFWARTRKDLPLALRSFQPDTLVMVVDAYDVIMFSCSRSIVSEFKAFNRDIVFATDKSCFPNPALCKSCVQRYGPDSPELKACEAFPHVNGGGYMGTAAALAEALEWMNDFNEEAGGDADTHLSGKDLENIYNYINRFPEKVALDHRQRIWTCLFGTELSHFHVEDCRVRSDYIEEEVCVVHANGQTRFTILAPLLEELENKGCRKRPPPRKADPYVGVLKPSNFVGGVR